MRQICNKKTRITSPSKTDYKRPSLSNGELIKMWVEHSSEKEMWCGKINKMITKEDVLEDLNRLIEKIVQNNKKN